MIRLSLILRGYIIKPENYAAGRGNHMSFLSIIEAIPVYLGKGYANDDQLSNLRVHGGDYVNRRNLGMTPGSLLA